MPTIIEMQAYNAQIQATQELRRIANALEVIAKALTEKEEK